MLWIFLGVAYLDLPATILNQSVDEENIYKVAQCPPPPLIFPDYRLIKQAATLLMQAKKPLLIIGKGSCNNKILSYRFKKKIILITNSFGILKELPMEEQKMKFVV